MGRGQAAGWSARWRRMSAVARAERLPVRAAAITVRAMQPSAACLWVAEALTVTVLPPALPKRIVREGARLRVPFSKVLTSSLRRTTPGPLSDTRTRTPLPVTEFWLAFSTLTAGTALFARLEVEASSGAAWAPAAPKSKAEDTMTNAANRPVNEGNKVPPLKIELLPAVQDTTVSVLLREPG
jgi:hypothetical protein